MKVYMKICVILLLGLAATVNTAVGQTVCDTVLSPDIKTVTLYRNGVELEAPVLRMSGNDRLMLSFDKLSPQPSSYRYRIMHCDMDWRRDGLEPYDFISGFEEGSIDNHNPSFTTLTDYVHYYQLIPSQYSRFLASGNYALEVYDQDMPDSVVLVRRFRVYEDEAAVTGSVAKPSNSADVFRNQEITVEVDLKPQYANPRYLHVIACQNDRTDLLRELPFGSYSGSKLVYRWNEANVFPGGNCFRYFDISNIHTAMYNVQKVTQYGGELFAFLRPDEDRSRKNFAPVQSLNGGMKINVWDRNDPQVEADYVWVTFSLPLERPFLDGSVHIVGALTDWSLGEVSRMEWMPQYKTYSKRMLLKQGYYAYQLLFLPNGETVGLTATLEGDHFGTDNRYTVYVYLRQPGDRYDRLLGVKRF